MSEGNVNGLVSAFVLSIIFSVSGAYAAQRQINQFTGSIDGKNCKTLLSGIAKNNDKVIGLKINITKSERNDPCLNMEDKEYYLISTSGKNLDGIEVLFNDGYTDHGNFVVDGFFLVKHGGVHQGISSYGLTKADEAAIRLAPHLKVVPIKVGN